MTVLDEVAQSNPDVWWWLKADGCDITKGLKESIKLKWSGDVDLNNGKLQEQYERYKKCLELAQKAGLERDKVENDLNELLQDLIKDLDYIHSGKLCKCNLIILTYVLAACRTEKF